jgi:hypothetical protein
VGGESVGTCYYNDVTLDLCPGSSSSPDASGEVCGIYQFFVGEMTTAFGGNLVFEVEGCYSCIDAGWMSGPNRG